MSPEFLASPQPSEWLVLIFAALFLVWITLAASIAIGEPS